MSAEDRYGQEPNWDSLTCEVCGGRPVTLVAGTSSYCNDHDPDDY